TMELYQRLKASGVLIVPGEYYFIGQPQEWPHAHECLRMIYVKNEQGMVQFFAIIAEYVHKAFNVSIVL
ncbi:valine--pyruvate transaminase, partial [Vibrio cholerae O1]|nr:valine--pyruvate transaminase [Vibrio cholerae O1]